jgi:diguanylate cyclase (GGDEF)-like protein
MAVATFRRALIALAGACAFSAVLAQTAVPTAGRASEIPRHALEIKALTQPEAVLAELPAQIDAARRAQDMHTLALLYLAQANACRVIADWPCQRSAGGQAREIAVLANEPVLEVRGLIADSRASIATQDFLRGERLLSEAELLLKKAPVPELMADVYLAYSSLSFTLNKYENSITYAERGLNSLPAGIELSTRARLLRNLGRAQAQLNQTEAARATLNRAHTLTAGLNDPKLSAELYLESARLAHVMRDVAAQRKSGEAVLALSRQLKNSQLRGQGHEVLGIAAVDAADHTLAETELRAAYSSFGSLKLDRDEQRVLRQLIQLLTAVPAGRNDQAAAVPIAPDIAALSARNIALSVKIEREDRVKAAEDFDARVKFMTSEIELKQLKGEAAAAKERENLLILVALLVLLSLAVLTGFFIQLRRNKILQERLARVDPLTGIANRRQFTERLHTALARCRRQQLPLTLLAFDIDKFKSINDTHGHAVGDAVIIEFARRIASAVREGDLAARLGGDEFLVLIEDATSAQVGASVAEKILERMRQPMQIGSLSLPVTTSIGVGFSTKPETSEAILDLADRALYAAKEAGRNTYRLL